jgi:hypothetical protein
MEESALCLAYGLCCTGALQLSTADRRLPTAD